MSIYVVLDGECGEILIICQGMLKTQEKAFYSHFQHESRHDAI